MTVQHTDVIDQGEIAATERVIRPHIRRTPIVTVSGSDFDLGGLQLTFKLEQLQHAGVFKTRGAFANLLTRHVPKAGVVAASGGNHGTAVAYAAMKLGIHAKIFVPNISSPAKIARIRGYGADLMVDGELYADALAASERCVAETGALPVHAFDQRETLLGQGTLALELEQQAPDLDTLLVAVGGGGLIGGIAAWYGRRIKVVGVEPEAAPTLTKALEAGHPVDAPAGGLAADFAGAKPNRQADVSNRTTQSRSRRFGVRPRNPARPGDAMVGTAARHRAGRCGAVCGPAVGELSA